LALKAALCRFRFAFIGLLFLINSRPAKVELYPWSNFRGPPLCYILRNKRNNQIKNNTEPFDAEDLNLITAFTPQST